MIFNVKWGALCAEYGLSLFFSKLYVLMICEAVLNKYPQRLHRTVDKHIKALGKRDCSPWSCLLIPDSLQLYKSFILSGNYVSNYEFPWISTDLQEQKCVNFNGLQQERELEKSQSVKSVDGWIHVLVFKSLILREKENPSTNFTMRYKYLIAILTKRY